MGMWGQVDWLAVLLQALGLVCAIEEFSLEELNRDDGKDEHEEDVNDKDVQDVLQRIDHTVKHRLMTHKHVSNWSIAENESINS